MQICKLNSIVDIGRKKANIAKLTIRVKAKYLIRANQTHPNRINSIIVAIENVWTVSQAFGTV